MYTRARIAKALNGLEITWIGEGGVEIPAIVICPKGKELSVKPYGVTPDEVIELLKRAKWSVSKTMAAHVRSERFCLLASEDVLQDSKWWQKYGPALMNMMENESRADCSSFKGIGAPICPFA